MSKQTAVENDRKPRGRFPPRQHDQKPKTEDGIRLDGSGSNYELFSTLFKEYGSKTYGRLIEELEMDQDIEIDIDEPEGDPESFAYKMGMEEAKLLVKEREDLRKLRFKLYGDILMHLSLMSERKVRQHENFEAADEDKSPRLLWNIVKDTHLIPQHAGNIGIWIVRDKLAQCKQGKHNIEEHCRRFRSIYNQLIALNDEEISQNQATQMFLISLDGRTYAEELSRWAAGEQLPRNLDEAIRKVTTWYRTTQNAIHAMTHDTRYSRGATDEVGFQAKTRGGGSGGGGSSKKKAAKEINTCPICNKKGSHTPDQCWGLEKFCEESLKKRAADESEEEGYNRAHPATSVNEIEENMVCHSPNFSEVQSH